MRDPVDPGAAIPPEARKAAMIAAHRRCIDFRRLRPVDIAALILPAIGAILCGIALNRVLARLGFDPTGIPWGLFSGLLYFGVFWLVYRRRHARLVYEELRTRGHNVCPVCGYFRAGIDNTTPCPECGTTLQG